MMGWQWHLLNHMQAICTLLQKITTPAPHQSDFFTGRMSFLTPNQQRQSTEGTTTRLEHISNFIPSPPSSLCSVHLVKPKEVSTDADKPEGLIDSRPSCCMQRWMLSATNWQWSSAKLSWQHLQSSMCCSKLF